MVHGGGWRTGDKALSRVVNNKAAWWLARSGVFVSVNNRLVPDAVRERIDDAISAYQQAVTKEAPFADILGPLC
jgi:acetyl esterase/lipase